MFVGLSFPTSGCWQIPGRHEGDELTFVVWVANPGLKALDGPNRIGKTLVQGTARREHSPVLAGHRV